MKTQKERRVKRFHVEVPIAFSLEDETGETPGIVYNLSPNGCRVASTTTVPPGRYLNIRLHLSPQEPPLAVSLAAVRWTTEHDFGINFLYMGPDEHQRLQGFFRDLEKTVSAVE